MSGKDATTSPGYRAEPSTSSIDRPSSTTTAVVPSPRAKAVLHFRHMLDMRRQRDKRFGRAFTVDHGWDLLLLLMIARMERRTTFGREIFREESAHGVTAEELDRQIELGNVILIDIGGNLERSQIVLSDEAARHLIDLYRLATAVQ